MSKEIRTKAVGYLDLMLTIGWWGAIAGLCVLGGVVAYLAIFPKAALSPDSLALYFSGLELEFTEPLPAMVTRDWLLLVLAVFGFPATIAALVILHQLRKVVATVRKGTPFIRENVRRIRVIGVAVLAMGFINSVSSFLSSYFVMQYVHIPGVEVNARLDLNLGITVIGLIVIFVLGEVFRVGVNLQEDQDLTV